MPKPTEAGKQFFRSVAPTAPGVEVKPMFGNLGAFVNGNMFAGLFGSSVGVKLAADDLAELRDRGCRAIRPSRAPHGRIPVPAHVADPEQAILWVNKAKAYVVTLPPKLKKKN